MKTPGINGVLCSDEQGLCLGAKGVAVGQPAGVISRMAHQAEQIHPDSGTSPVIVVESEVGNVLIKNHDGITLAIFKSPV
ncbi:ragulator complex protein LAMTOR5-like isoform X2 [Liolophura sinensis]